MSQALQSHQKLYIQKSIEAMHGSGGFFYKCPEGSVSNSAD